MPLFIVVIVTFIITILLGTLIFFRQRKNYKHTFEDEKKVFTVARKIEKLLLQTTNTETILQKIADFVPQELNFATGVVALYDENNQTVRRVAASSTKEAIEAIDALKKMGSPFSEIAIPLNDPNNLLSRSVREKTEFVTSNVHDVFTPLLSAEASAEIQKIMSIRSTIIYPIYIADKPIGAFLASSKKLASELTEYEKNIISVFVDAAGIGLQNSQLFTSLKNANEELKKLNKMKDEFVFIATHDLKTPVTAIDGYISLIEKKQPKFSEDIEKNFEEVKAASDRLKQLINDLLQVARGESGTIKVEIAPVDINEIITKVREEVQVIADNKKVKLTTNFDPSVKIVLGDALKLPEIIENLMSNAIKFNNPDGSVVVTTKKAENFLEIAIADTGHGIPIAEQSRVFEKFFKYRNEKTQDVPGTGLGLFVVKMLIEKMGGKISFTSAEEKGTTFTFTLPLAS